MAVLATERRGDRMVVWFGEPATSLPAPGDPSSPLAIPLKDWEKQFPLILEVQRAALVAQREIIDLSINADEYMAIPDKDKAAWLKAQADGQLASLSVVRGGGEWLL